MPFITNALDYYVRDLFLDLGSHGGGARCILKLEGANGAGSIKFKSAAAIVADAEEKGIIRPGSTLVESSSGNLGVAMSLICRLKGYRFICVSDPNITASNAGLMTAYGARLIIVKARDSSGGYLGTRLAAIAEILERQPDAVWLNQYKNVAPVRAHYEETANEILAEIPRVSALFVGSGTTGTLVGVSRRFREVSPETRIIAVEPKGSTTFDATQKGKRLIPGIGTSQRPALADLVDVDQIVYIEEERAIKSCHSVLESTGLLLGGSTGSVVCAMLNAAESASAIETYVGISPDFGHPYLNTVYSDAWVHEHFGVQRPAYEPA